MATNLTIALRNNIERHIVDLFFPEETIIKLNSSLDTLWESYLDENFGNPLKVSTCDYMANYCISFSKDKEMGRKYSLLHQSISFYGRFVNLPFCSDKDFPYVCIDIDKCPITNFRNTVIALINFQFERKIFSTALYSELLKNNSVEAFAKKFPNLKGSLSPWLEDSITDLPVECSIDLDSVGMSIAV